MKNAQPTSWDKGIKEGRLDFTTPPPKSHTQTHAHTPDHSSSIYARSLKTHNLAHTHTHTRTHATQQHTEPTKKKKKQQHGLATQHMFPQSV